MTARPDQFTRSVRSAREAFLATGEVNPTVRAQIEASWRRSSESGVQPELRQLPGKQELIERNGRLYVAAKPVLQDLAARLSNTSTSVMLADKKARMIDRWVGEPSLRRRLDRANSVDGQSLHEDIAGTNGLGSVLAEQQPVQVLGPEHYIEAFQAFSCVGAPVRHPISGHIEGIVTLVVRYEDTNELLFPLLLQVAQDIQERMLLQATARERMLLDTFLSVARRSSRPVVSVSDQLIITNAAAARLLDRDDHAVLWDFAAQTGTPGVRTADLPLTGGAIMSARLRPVDDGVEVYGAVIELDSAQIKDRRRERMLPAALPGLAGRSAGWLRICDETIEGIRTGLPMLVVGDRGAGKLALIEAALMAGGINAEITVVDAALQPIQGAASWVGEVRSHLVGRQVVVIRHIESLDEQAAQALATMVDALPTIDGPRIIGTLVEDPGSSRPGIRGLIDRLAVTRVVVPPLAHRRADIPDLLQALTRRHTGDRPGIRWGADVIAALVAADWTGNVRQLENLVRRQVAGRHAGEVQLHDLPDDLRHHATEQNLSVIERLERQAIVATLGQHGGNRTQTADALGISRATLYRRLSAFGLDD